ncbi:hypothetical protein X975_05024, partial [Stegodyphus mimosarum]
MLKSKLISSTAVSTFASISVLGYMSIARVPYTCLSIHALYPAVILLTIINYFINANIGHVDFCFFV